MNDVHLGNFDLNLLRVFVALLEEGGATKAGARLGLTQSAVSHALGRLRLALGDELFIRDTAGLQPTPRALEMGEPIRAALQLFEAAVAVPRFDPATDKRTFHIAAGPYVSRVLLPSVVGRLLDAAPGVNLDVRSADASLADDLDRGRLDMAIASFQEVPPRFVHRPLFTETGVWALRAGHPAAAQEITPKVLASLPRLTVSSNSREDGLGALGGRDLGLRRMTSWGGDYALEPELASAAASRIVVEDSYSALVMISQTDLTALIPRRLAMLAQHKTPLILVEPIRPAVASFGAVVRSSDRDIGPVAWLLDLIAQVASEA